MRSFRYETAGFYHFVGVARPEFTITSEEERDLRALLALVLAEARTS